MASGLRRWGLEPLLDDEELEVDISLTGWSILELDMYVPVLSVV